MNFLCATNYRETPDIFQNGGIKTRNLCSEPAGHVLRGEQSCTTEIHLTLYKLKDTISFDVQ